ncbi:hypothetical protein [Mycobacterium noviomagense]|uniref:Uncharacterized protein n=1 Tax=Mycobacterium noviomagense TaxID=459858 RepID=A0A7I7PA30_9MYCO|nr:hypothetical protein [Mycobacterium noviomagense]ORB13000.1 hypothetical protein BST37_14935 [Mycobacterium noviomagense]BBY05415.1 hypothetical protein MNVI_07330 [Mycobacterium noviomagense]
MTDQPRFLGKIQSVAVRDLSVAEDISFPITTSGTQSVGLRSTIQGFNDERTEMTIFVHKAGETVTVEVDPDQQFDRV